MEQLSVEQLMSTDLVTIEPGASAAEAASRMLETGVGSIVAVDADDHLVGLITATDFVSLVRQNHPKDETPVEAFMTRDVVTVGPNDTVEELAEPTAHGYTHLPVVDESGALIGMISTTDLTAYVSESR